MSGPDHLRPLRVTARSIQIALGCLWLLDGLLQLQPKMFGAAFANDVIMPSAQGQPGIVSGMITHMAHLISAQPILVNLVFAGVQLFIGAGLLVRETVKPALLASFAWSLGVWSLGEGFGGLLNGSAAPLTGAPGAAVLYLAIGLLVWPKRGGPEISGPATSEGLLGERGGRAIWALVWCGLGALWFLPASRAGGALSGAITGASTGQPGWLAHLQISVAHALASQESSVAVVAGLLSLVIGLGPLFVHRSTAFLVAGVAVALDCWVLGQSFGQIFSGTATDPNTGPLLFLLALANYRGKVPSPAAVTPNVLIPSAPRTVSLAR
jgi:hypothetical protein